MIDDSYDRYTTTTERHRSSLATRMARALPEDAGRKNHADIESFSRIATSSTLKEKKTFHCSTNIAFATTSGALHHTCQEWLPAAKGSFLA